MQLGTADLGGELCPVAQARQLETGRIDQPDGIGDLLAESALSLIEHGREELGEDRAGTVGVGIGKGRARRRTRAKVIETGVMAGEPGDDLAQTRRSAQLTVEEREELTFGGQPAHPEIGAMLLHQPLEDRPRNVLGQGMEDAILVTHGVDPFFSCPERRQIALNTEESTPCTLSTKTQPDSRGSSRRMTAEWWAVVGVWSPEPAAASAAGRLL